MVYHEDNRICMSRDNCLFEEKLSNTTYVCKDQCGVDQFQYVDQTNGHKHTCVPHCPRDYRYYTKFRKCTDTCPMLMYKEVRSGEEEEETVDYECVYDVSDCPLYELEDKPQEDGSNKTVKKCVTGCSEKYKYVDNGKCVESC